VWNFFQHFIETVKAEDHVTSCQQLLGVGNSVE
jgi:hypothetical protein